MYWRKFIKLKKNKIYEVIQLLLDMENVNFQNKGTIELAFKTYTEKNLDIVDCMLYAYAQNEKYDVKTFDKKLDKLIKSL